MSNHPWEKWAKRPATELLSRLNDLTSLILTEVDEDNDNLNLETNPYECPAYMDSEGNMRNTQRDGVEGLCDRIRTYSSEAHWISEELEHRIRKTKYAGIHDIKMTGNGKKKKRRRRGPSGGGSGGGTLAYPQN